MRDVPSDECATQLAFMLGLASWKNVTDLKWTAVPFQGFGGDLPCFSVSYGISWLSKFDLGFINEKLEKGIEKT